MGDFETEVELAKLNRDLAELWIDEVDLLEIHRNASSRSDDRVCPVVNRMYRQRERCLTVIRGAELREIFGYTDPDA